MTGALTPPLGSGENAMFCGESQPVAVVALTPVPDTGTASGAFAPVTLTETRPLTAVALATVGSNVTWTVQTFPAGKEGVQLSLSLNVGLGVMLATFTR